MKRALDLFCGGGGASVGLHRAGYEVIGVDHVDQPQYPFKFIKANALEYPIENFDLVWASPPCQAFSSATRNKENYENLIPETRARLEQSKIPYVIENVPGAPLLFPTLLCGAMFDLGVIRHRIFETSFSVVCPPHQKHKGSLVTGEYITVAGNGGVPAWTLKERERRGMERHREGEMHLETWRKAMGIDWLDLKPLTQAIPPVYSEYLARFAP